MMDNPPFRSPIRAIVAAFLIAASCCAPACTAQFATPNDSSAIPVRLDPVHPNSNSTVTFSAKYLGPIPYASISGKELQDVQMLDPTYRAGLDLSSLARDKTGRFIFTLYVNRANLFQKSVDAYEIGEDPTGGFNDTIQPVNIYIGSDRSALPNSTPLPLHSPYGSPTALAYKPANADPQSLPMGKDFTFHITLDSALDQLGASLGDATATINCDRCLQTLQVKLSKTALSLNDQVDATFTISPSTFKAMAAAAQPESDKYDATITLVVPVTADKGGSRRDQTVPIRVKFTPPLTGIALGVILGTLFGAFIRMYLGTTHTNKQEFYLGLIYAIVCWLFALLLFANGKTAIKLLGFNFDPTQMFPAFMLCLFAGGGPPLVQLLKNSVLGSMLGEKQKNDA